MGSNESVPCEVVVVVIGCEDGESVGEVAGG